ncbi:PqiC family protein [Paraburkholderia hayleyella]|uniref:PqiC family protein n=1 Tax=Paraburkholderia hayleyella TaxID=2152889 RepID=UPI001292A4C0|nr:PqiC family protein [Paraburkholderia hayleyella]
MTLARLSHLRRRPLARTAACASLVASAALLTACASPSSNFYTLGGSDSASPSRLASTPALLIEVPRVEVPSQVARNQFVIQNDPLKVRVLEQERWISLPDAEIRRALSSSLTQQLDTFDVSGTPRPSGVPLYRVNFTVQRFESWPGSHALIDAVWSVRAVDNPGLAVLTCRSIENEPVKSGYEALADGHRRALQRIAAQIASGIRMLAAAPGPSGRRPPPAKPTPAALRLPCPASAATGAPSISGSSAPDAVPGRSG